MCSSDLTRWLGGSTAEWLYHKVRGEARAAVEPRAPARQMSREETFDRDRSDRAAIEHELRYLARKVAADLREEGLAARTITVKLRTNDWTTRTASRTLDAAVESDRAVVDTALALLADLRVKQTRPAQIGRAHV